MINGFSVRSGHAWTKSTTEGRSAVCRSLIFLSGVAERMPDGKTKNDILVELTGKMILDYGLSVVENQKFWEDLSKSITGKKNSVNGVIPKYILEKADGDSFEITSADFQKHFKALLDSQR